jgi:hypothetical protein
MLRSSSEDEFINGDSEGDEHGSEEMCVVVYPMFHEIDRGFKVV